MWMTAFITNLAIPLSVLGVIGILLCGLMWLIYSINRTEETFGSDPWIYKGLVAKRFRNGLFCAVLMVMVGFSIPKVDYQTKTVYVEKKVEVHPKWKEMYDICRGNVNQSDTNNLQGCVNTTNQQLESMKKYAGVQ